VSVGIFCLFSFSDRDIISKDDVISVKGNMFYLDGELLAEISFNKFDLFWAIWDSALKGEKLNSDNVAVQRQDKALSDLSRAGFRTLRFFGLPHSSKYQQFKEVWTDPVKRAEIFYPAMDIVLDLCEKHRLSAVFSLGCGIFVEQSDGEHLRELVGNPDSKSRQALMNYLEDFIPRYKNHKAIGMWEITNELTLQADIMPGTLTSKGQRMPTMVQVARFYTDITARIKRLDPLRIVTRGGSAHREYAYGLHTGKGCSERDKYSDHVGLFRLIQEDTGMDVFDIHYYVTEKPNHEIRDDDGNPFWLDLQEYKKIADILHLPIYAGEYGALPQNRNDRNRKFWTENPNWFETFGKDEPDAIYWVQKTADMAVASGIPLIHWWCYQSDRSMDQKELARMDMDMERTPELFQIVVRANKKLKEKFLHNAD
jgi:hypothetical protein